MTATIEPFGTTADGYEVARIVIRHGELTFAVLTLGAVLQDLRLAGTPWPLTLGGNDLSAYAGPMAFNGAIVGPVANRIAGALAEVDGQPCRLDANEGGITSLHGGRQGTWAQVWALQETRDDGLRLTLDLPAGQGGLPGTRRITADYAVEAGHVLVLRLTATTDAPTLMNLAHHGYWNLDGTPTLDGHRMTIDAGHYTPVDARLIPTGEIAPVAGTGFDFRSPAPLPGAQDIDHNFCLTAGRDPAAPALRLEGAKGVVMEITTTEPGLQVYDGARMDTAPHPGLTGAPYGRHAGVALEPQRWPVAPHQPAFPSIRLAPGETYRQESRFAFFRR